MSLVEASSDPGVNVDALAANGQKAKSTWIPPVRTRRSSTSVHSARAVEVPASGAWAKKATLVEVSGVVLDV